MAVTGEGEVLATNGVQIRCQGVLVTQYGDFQGYWRPGMLRDGVEDVDDGHHRRGRGLGDKTTTRFVFSMLDYLYAPV